MPDRDSRRRALAVAGGTLVAAGALAALLRSRRKHPALTLANGTPYVRFGTGKAPLVVLWGGPGNNLPSGLFLRLLRSRWAALAQDYTIYILSRRSGLPAGYSTRQMAGDVADAIRQAFALPVDVIGESFGGMIVQHLAADYADVVRRLVIASAAYRLGEEGKRLDTEYARYAAAGDWGRAYASAVSGAVQRAFVRIMGTLGKPAVSETFAQDIQVELQADLRHDTRDRLRAIRAPTLVACGDEDPYFTVDLVRETAALIPGATLRLYPGMGHDLIVDNRFVADVYAFLTQGSISAGASL